MLLNFMSAFIIFFTTLFVVLQKDMTSAGLAGVSITYAMQVRYADASGIQNALLWRHMSVVASPISGNTTAYQ